MKYVKEDWPSLIDSECVQRCLTNCTLYTCIVQLIQITKSVQANMCYQNCEMLNRAETTSVSQNLCNGRPMKCLYSKIAKHQSEPWAFA